MPDLITWPSVVLALGVLFIIVFRRPIADLLGRTRKVGKGGLETYDNAQLPAPTDTRTEVEKFLRTYDNPLLLEQEGSIRMDLKNRKLDAPADSQQVLRGGPASLYSQTELDNWIGEHVRPQPGGAVA